MLDYCIHEKHFENIWADHFTGNPASGKVMEKCGFSDTGMLNRCSQLIGGDKEMVKIFKYKDNKSLITFSARQTDLVRFGELQSQGFSAEVYVKRIYPQIIVYILLSSAGGNSSGRIPCFSSISSHFGYSAMQMDSIKVHLLVRFSPSYSQQILPSFATDQESGGNGHQYCRYKY